MWLITLTSINLKLFYYSNILPHLFKPSDGLLEEQHLGLLWNSFDVLDDRQLSRVNNLIKNAVSYTYFISVINVFGLFPYLFKLE